MKDANDPYEVCFFLLSCFFFCDCDGYRDDFVTEVKQYYSQNKKNILTENNFLVPSARKFDLN